MTATVTPIRREFQVHRFNPTKNGVLSRHIVLPWEDREDYEEILRGLLIEHQPRGPTAYHLVEDLACVIWRKRRLLQAEHARLLDGFHDATTGFRSKDLAARALTFENRRYHGGLASAVTRDAHDPEISASSRADIEAWIESLQRGSKSAFKTVVGKLGETMAAEWAELSSGGATDDDVPYSRTPHGLIDYLTGVLDETERHLEDAHHAPAIASHAQGSALSLKTHAIITKIEAHLDQKMQRLLAVLKDLKGKK